MITTEKTYKQALDIYFQRAEREMRKTGNVGQVKQPCRNTSLRTDEGWFLKNVNGLLDFVRHDAKH